MKNHLNNPHSHAAGNIRLAFLLNLLFTAVAVGGGLLSGSNAVLAESVHNLGCTVSLGLAWLFQVLALKEASARHNFGYGRYQIAGALINGVVITAGSVIMVIESLEHIFMSEESHASAQGMMAIAVLGIICKGISMFRTHNGKGVNERLVSLHMLSDLMGWVVVLLAGILMLFVEIPLLDSILSIGIAVFILINVLRGLADAFTTLMDSNPIPNQYDALKLAVSGAKGVHLLEALKVWSEDGEHLSAIVQLQIDHEVPVGEVRSIVTDILTANGIDQVYFDVKQ